LRKIKVYKAEEDAGLTEQIQNSTASVMAKASYTDLANEDKAVLIKKILQFLNKETAVVHSLQELIGKDQPDLALIVSILVSAGWNLNDDIFVPAELWKARETANHKPINDGHDEESILGHIVQSRVLDKSGNLIDTDDNLPIEFDIEVAGVLYKALPKLQDRVDEIMNKANSGDMFVSMEAWFPDFAFGVLGSQGQTQLVARSEETAFLTKHLRIFGGNGEFNGQRIGRVLLDINFGGLGFVEMPANPESVIKVAASEELQAVASNIFKDAKLNDITEGGVTGMENMDALKKALESAEAQVAVKDASIAKLTKDLEGAKKEDSDAKISQLCTEVDDLNTTIDEAKKSAEAFETEKAGLQTQLDEMIKRAEDAETKLVEIEKDTKADKRLARLKEVSAVEDDKKTLVEIREWSDETFDSVLKYAGSKAEDTTNTAKDASSETDETDSDTQDDTTTAALDNVKEDKEPDYQAGTENAEESEMEVAIATAMALFGNDKEENEEGGE